MTNIAKYIVPDNNDIYDYFENERERLKRLKKKQEYEEDLDIDDLPFYE